MPLKRSQRLIEKQFAVVAPATLSEKILFKMAYDRRPVLTALSDNAAVCEFVEEGVVPDVLTKVYKFVESPDDLRLDLLSELFVI